MRQLQYYLDLILILTIKEFKIKYKGSILGYIWSLLNPLLLTIIFYFAFKIVLKIPTKDYLLFLIAGLFPWQWFANSLSISPNILIYNANIIKKIYFPRCFLPLAVVLSEMIHFLLSIPIIFITAIFYKKIPSYHWFLGIPLILIPQFLFTFGLTLLISALNVFFRDLERIVFFLLTIIFYLTPIIYDESLIPTKYKLILSLNPLYGIIHLWKDLFINNNFDFIVFLIYFSYSLVIFILCFFSGCA